MPAFRAYGDGGCLVSVPAELAGLFCRAGGAVQQRKRSLVAASAVAAAAAECVRASKKQRQRPQPSLDALPDECLFEVLRRLPGGRERGASACVSRRWLALLGSIRPCELGQAAAAAAPSLPDLNEEFIMEDKDESPVDPCVERVLEGKDATDVRLAAMAVVAGSRGGLEKLAVRGSHPTRGVTDQGLLAVARGSPNLCSLALWDVPLVTDAGLAEIAAGLKELCADKSNLQKEQTKSQKQKSAKNQLRLAEEPIDPNNARVIQRKLVYIVGMPSELSKDKVLRQKNFLGQYGKIENVIIDNIGANQQIPDSGRVYVTFSREEEAVRCIEAVNGYILDGRPLKATFGVTRYCHVWLSNKVCRKPNCSYVHQKAPAEDICTKDDVAVVCARLQHLLGMDMKGLQQRSGSTLPSPGDCNSRTTICSGNFKDKTCIKDGGVLPNIGNKNPGTMPAATPWDSSFSSGNSSSIVNATCHQQNDHESILNNQQKFSASKCEEFPPLGPKDCLNEQLASNDDKSQASVQLGNVISNSKQMTSAGNGTVDTLLRKPQYVNVVSQGSSGSGCRFTVLTRQVAPNDTRSKATGQVGNVISNSKKVSLAKNEHSDSITIPRCQNVKVVSQRPESPHKLTSQLASSIVSHAGAEEKKACSDISDKPVQGKHMQLSENTASHSSTALQSLSGSPTTLSNLSTSDVKSQMSVGQDKLSVSHRKLASENQLQLLNQQKVAVSNTDIAGASDWRSTLNNQVLPTDGKHQTSAQGGDHSLYNREMTVSGDQISSQHAESVLLSRPVSVLSSTDIAAKDSKGRKRQVCPPGFKELHHSSDSGKFVSVSSSTCSALCSTSDALVQDSDIISWVSECLEDDGDTKQSNSVSISSTLGSIDTTWRCTQFPSSCFSGASNQLLLSPYPGGLLQCMGGVENTMRCCRAFPPISSAPNKKPEYWNGTANSYLSTGGYDAFGQNSTSGMKAGMVGTLLQQPSPPNLYNDWTNGNADSGLKSSQIDLSYPMYSLFG